MIRKALLAQLVTVMLLTGTTVATADDMQPDPVAVQVGDELLHQLEGRVSKLLAGKKCFIASDGEHIGVLPVGDQSYAKAYILLGDRVEAELTFQPPTGENLKLFGFAFDHGRQLYILNGLVKHFVYKKKQYLSTFDFVSRTADFHDDELLWSLEPIIWREVPKDGPPLLVLSDLSERDLKASDCKPLLRSDLSSVSDEEGPDAVMYQELTARYRKDGKIWSVGRFSGEIKLLSNTAKVLAEYNIEPEAEAVDEQAMKAELLASVNTPVDKPNAKVVLHTPTNNTVISSIATYGNDLLILPSNYSKHHNTLIMLDTQGDRFYYFFLPEVLSKSRIIATTEDAVWFERPVSWIELDDLMTLVRNEEENEVRP